MTTFDSLGHTVRRHYPGYVATVADFQPAKANNAASSKLRLGNEGLL
jgi:hypothetical protein